MPTLRTIISVNNSLYAAPVEKFGTHDQKEKWLTPYATGEKLGALAMPVFLFFFMKRL